MDRIALSVCCLILPATAAAGTSEILASNNQASLQFVSTYVNYTETGNGIFGTHTGVLDTETGSVPGAALSVSFMVRPEHLYFRAGYDYSSLYTNYTGSLQGGSFGSVMSRSSAILVNYGARLGKGITLRDSFMLTPYFEFGRHEWNRGVNYGEIYTHDYLGLGILGQYSPAAASAFVFSLNAMLGETRESYIVVKPGSRAYGFEGGLGDSPLMRFGLAADYAITKRLHGNLAADYESFRYGMSAVYPVGAGFVAWEPDSRTYYTTLRLGLGLAF